MSLCVEVHSIGANKLDPSLIPIIAGHNDAHVFEMELEGGMKERFAARSVKDRGSWVSKIWWGLDYSLYFSLFLLKPA
jgi:hypothetical protein